MVQLFINNNYSKNEIKHKKFVKQIQLVKEKNELEQKNKGLAFVEFIDSQVALKFMGYLIQDQQYKKINNALLPIIEFAIQDIRVINKKLKIFEKKQEHQKQIQERNNVEKKKEKKEKKEKQRESQDKVNKQIIEQMITNDTVVQNKAKIKEILKRMKSRGTRQRLRKRIEKQYGEIFD